MAIELRQQLKLTQQLIMTPQLQMAIKLLQLSRLELLDTIRQELEENPALEEVAQPAQETVAEKTREQIKAEEKSQQESPQEKTFEDIEWTNYFDEYSPPGRYRFESEDKEAPRFENFIALKKSFQDHLLWQLLMTSPTPEQEHIGSLIIGNLNADGYLDAFLEDLAASAGLPLEKVEQMLEVVQGFDPMGVGARDLRECLLLQIERLNLDNPLVETIVKNHMGHLENRNFKAIAQKMKVDIQTVAQAVNIIRSLEPRPGREFNDEDPHYINPDIFVHKIDNEFVIALNDDGLPKLKVNAFYKNAITGDKNVSQAAKDYIQDKMRSAAWLIRSIHQRQKTIYKVMESILRFQREFFEKGIGYLQPMVLRDVAQDIEMHESTISRVTTNKYAFTPQGIFELKYFFNSSINRVHGGSIASASVMDKIRQIIENENPKKPYSDEKISKLLTESNIDIARRTVAKYREIMKILPSNKRRRY